MGADTNGSQYPRSPSNIDMTLDYRDARTVASSDSYLLKDEAIDTDCYIGMYHDPVRVRDKEATSDIAIEWDLRPGDNAPKTVA
jgi:hypothetical protein